MCNHSDSRLSARRLVNESHLNTSQEAAAAAKGTGDIKEMQDFMGLVHGLAHRISTHPSRSRPGFPPAALVMYRSRLAFPSWLSGDNCALSCTERHLCSPGTEFRLDQPYRAVLSNTVKEH